MAVSTTLFLVRHGEVEANRRFVFVGDSDPPLTEEGSRQADALGEALAPFALGALYTSPLLRARATAEVVARHCGLEATVEEALAEMSFGAWEGRTWEDVAYSDRAAFQAWQEDPSQSPPGGESRGELASRTLACVQQLAARHRGGSIGIVSHVGPIKAVLERVLAGDARSFFLDPGTVTVVEWDETPVLRLFNSHAHLGWERPRWRDSR